MLWSSWVDDLLSCGNKDNVLKGRETLKQHFDLDKVRELKEYVGCKVEYDKVNGQMKLTQPVLVQSFADEFDLPTRTFTTLMSPEQVLVGKGAPIRVSEAMHRQYQKGVGKLIHLGKYSKPVISNAVRELSGFGSNPNEAQYLAMLQCLKYCVDTKDEGFVIHPLRQWNGKDRGFQFQISGESDSTFASCLETQRSESGWRASLEGVPYTRKSKMQRFVTLSVTEAECVTATSCVQNMIYGKNFLELLGLQVELLMILEMDNNGGVDIFNNWSIAGNTRAVSIRFAYIRELKEARILEIRWIDGKENTSDLFTKNLDGMVFKMHASVFNGVA